MPRTRSIRYHLTIFGIALLVPLFAFSAFLIWQFASEERSHYQAEALQAADRAIAAVDRELIGMQAFVRALATSGTIHRRDYQTFQAQAMEALQVWAPDAPRDFALVLRDRTGRQVANTRLPWGTPLPQGANPKADQHVIETRRPVIQDIFVGATAGHPIISIRVPVFENDEVTHVLSMAVEPSRFAESLQMQAVSSEWTLAVLDRNLRIVARNRDHQQFVGTEATEDLRRHAVDEQGAWTGFTKEGVSVLAAYDQSNLTGWRAAVGVPLAVLEAPLRRSLWALGALGLLSVAGSFALATFFGRRISSPVRSLDYLAGQLRRGDAASPPVTGLREVDEVGQAIATASNELRARERALRASEQRLRATHENAAVGIIEVDEEGRVLDVNETQCRLLSAPREQLIGRIFSDHTHPDFLDEDQALFHRQTSGELEVYTIEKQHVRGNGAIRWARVSSKAVHDEAGDFLYAVRVVEDITDRKTAELHQKLLIDELNHRVKNTLATVQSIAAQTFKNTPTEALPAFEARLMALSRAHNLLTRTNWAGAQMQDVVSEAVTAFRHGAERTFTISGPPLELSPKMALALSMALHELATNAAKYGALSVEAGRVVIMWTTDCYDGKACLHLRWEERDGPAVSPPTRAGFGSRLIQRGLAAELGGQVDVRYRSTGAICTIDAPLAAGVDPVWHGDVSPEAMYRERAIAPHL